jgi:hypothetical protein
MPQHLPGPGFFARHRAPLEQAAAATAEEHTEESADAR